MASEHAHQPLQGVREPTAAFEVPRLLRQGGKQVRQALASDREEPPIRRDSHDRLSHAQRDDLGVCDPTRSVLCSIGQEIVGRDKNGREQRVEVGVHRGPLGSAMLMSTADFDLAAPNPLKSPTNTATAVESLT